LAAKAMGFPIQYHHPVMPRWTWTLDLRCFRARFCFFHSVSFFARDPVHGMPFTYPAPSAIIYLFFYILPRPTRSFAVITGGFVLLAAILFARALVRRGIAAHWALGFVLLCVLCSWPLMVVFWLENIEIVIGILLGFGLYFFVSGRSWAAATLISLAAAAKIFPFIFLVLFFEKKLYKQMVFFVVLAAFANLAALWMLTGSVAISSAGVAGGLKYLQDVYVLPFSADTTGLDHSIFGLFKTLLEYFYSPYPNLAHMAVAARVYTCVMGIADVALYVFYIRFRPFLNRLLCICILAVLTTPMSHDYTLMHLYVSWGMLVLLAVEAWTKKVEIPGLKAAFVCFLILLCPLSEIMFRGSTVGGQIKCFTLIALLVVALRHPFISPEQPSVCAPAPGVA
jgi:hypothetical protein